jgi:hypothetical protein
MSKEPIKREVEQDQPVEGWKHGSSEAQIKIIEDARGEPKQPRVVEEKRDDKKHQ